MAMKEVAGKRIIGIFCLFLFLGLIVSLANEAGAAGAKYPNRPITLVVPYPPGGSTDLAARAFAESLEKIVKQPVVVSNKAGGASTIGGNAVALAKPDGYTLGYLPFHTANPEAYSYFMEAPYSGKDFRPICTVTAGVSSIAVKTEAPWKTLKELIDYAKKNPGLKCGTSGPGTPPYRLLMTLGKQEKFKFVHVPFQGDADVCLALLGDHISFAPLIYAAGKNLADGKKIRFLAVSAPKRLEFAPDIPTVKELGYPSASPDPQAVYGPKGTPDEVVKVISDAGAKIVVMPEYRSKVQIMGVFVNFEDAAVIEKANAQVKDEIVTFFKEEGLVK
jgi:tripartite-type tricarboxylate transporter receptor subunit TctC